MPVSAIAPRSSGPRWRWGNCSRQCWQARRRETEWSLPRACGRRRNQSRPQQPQPNRKSSRSRLPPLRMMPTLRPAKRSRWRSTTARASAADASTTSLRRSKISRIAASACSSLASRISQPRSWRMANGSGPSSARRPSQIVSALRPVTRCPLRSDSSASAAPSG